MNHPPEPNDDPLAAREQELMAAMADAEPQSPLDLQLVELEGVPVLRLGGELDIHTVGLLRERLNALLAAGPPSIIVDLSRLRYIDSRGMAALLQASLQLTGTLALVCAQERIARLFEATGLADHMPLYRTLPEAVAAVRPHRSGS
jgi:anti-sigma B factor antagonist